MPCLLENLHKEIKEIDSSEKHIHDQIKSCSQVAFIAKIFVAV